MAAAGPPQPTIDIQVVMRCALDRWRLLPPAAERARVADRVTLWSAGDWELSVTRAAILRPASLDHEAADPATHPAATTEDTTAPTAVLTASAEDRTRFVERMCRGASQRVHSRIAWTRSPGRLLNTMGVSTSLARPERRSDTAVERALRRLLVHAFDGVHELTRCIVHEHTGNVCRISALGYTTKGTPYWLWLEYWTS